MPKVLKVEAEHHQALEEEVRGQAVAVGQLLILEVVEQALILVVVGQGLIASEEKVVLEAVS